METDIVIFACSKPRVWLQLQRICHYISHRDSGWKISQLLRFYVTAIRNHLISCLVERDLQFFSKVKRVMHKDFDLKLTCHFDYFYSKKLFFSCFVHRCHCHFKNCDFFLIMYFVSFMVSNEKQQYHQLIELPL